MVPYIITLIPLTEELQAVDPELLDPFYSNDLVIDGSMRLSAKLLCLIVECGLSRIYFSNTAKSMFTADTFTQEEVARRTFVMEGLELKFVSVSCY